MGFPFLKGFTQDSSTVSSQKVADNSGTERKTFDSDGYLYQRDTKITTAAASLNDLATKTGTETLTNKTLSDVSVAVTIVAGENLAAGDLVYPSGYDATAKKIIVSKADADANNPAKVAWFVAQGTIAKDATGTVYGAYELTGQNTNSASAVGDPVYLSTTAGGWSLTAPTGGGQAIQQVGVVTVKNASTGKVLLLPFYSKAISVNTTE